MKCNYQNMKDQRVQKRALAKKKTVKTISHALRGPKKALLKGKVVQTTIHRSIFKKKALMHNKSRQESQVMKSQVELQIKQMDLQSIVPPHLY